MKKTGKQKTINSDDGTASSLPDTNNSDDARDSSIRFKHEKNIETKLFLVADFGVGGAPADFVVADEKMCDAFARLSDIKVTSSGPCDGEPAAKMKCYVSVPSSGDSDSGEISDATVPTVHWGCDSNGRQVFLPKVSAWTGNATECTLTQPLNVQGNLKMVSNSHVTISGTVNISGNLKVISKNRAEITFKKDVFVEGNLEIVDAGLEIVDAKQPEKDCAAFASEGLVEVKGDLKLANGAFAKFRSMVLVHQELHLENAAKARFDGKTTLGKINLTKRAHVLFQANVVVAPISSLFAKDANSSDDSIRSSAAGPIVTVNGNSSLQLHATTVIYGKLSAGKQSPHEAGKQSPDDKPLILCLENKDSVNARRSDWSTSAPEPKLLDIIIEGKMDSTKCQVKDLQESRMTQSQAQKNIINNLKPKNREPENSSTSGTKNREPENSSTSGKLDEIDRKVQVGTPLKNFRRKNVRIRKLQDQSSSSPVSQIEDRSQLVGLVTGNGASIPVSVGTTLFGGIFRPFNY